MTKNEIFALENALRSKARIHISPSGRYVLTVTPFETGTGYWNCTQGDVSTAHDVAIAKVRRNYHAFPFAWVEGHPNGHDYLVCGENYQGQTVIELDTGRRGDYLPKEARYGSGFCWADFQPSPDGTMIAVEGCIWAGPYEVLIVDFSSPLAGPWPVIHRDSENDRLFGWSADGSAQLGREVEVCHLPGHPLHGRDWGYVPAEQLEAFDAELKSRGIAEDEGYRTIREVRIWRKPE